MSQTQCCYLTELLFNIWVTLSNLQALHHNASSLPPEIGGGIHRGVCRISMSESTPHPKYLPSHHQFFCPTAKWNREPGTSPREVWTAPGIVVRSGMKQEASAGVISKVLTAATFSQAMISREGRPTQRQHAAGSLLRLLQNLGTLSSVLIPMYHWKSGQIGTEVSTSKYSHGNFS